MFNSTVVIKLAVLGIALLALVLAPVMCSKAKVEQAVQAERTSTLQNAHSAATANATQAGSTDVALQAQRAAQTQRVRTKTNAAREVLTQREVKYAENPNDVCVDVPDPEWVLVFNAAVRASSTRNP